MLLIAATWNEHLLGSFKPTERADGITSYAATYKVFLKGLSLVLFYCKALHIVNFCFVRMYDISYDLCCNNESLEKPPQPECFLLPVQ